MLDHFLPPWHGQPGLAEQDRRTGLGYEFGHTLVQLTRSSEDLWGMRPMRVHHAHAMQVALCRGTPK